MRAKFLSSILVVIALAAITACGGSSKSIPPVIAVSVSPTTAQVAGSATEQFTATVTNTTNTAVTWSVTGGGSINVAGLYTAPASVPTQAAVTVTATSQADSTKTATAAITLEADSVSVGPTTAQIPAAGTQQFTATVNNANPAVTWSVTGPGSISASGLYTAPNAIPSQTSITVKAVLKADTGATSSTKATLLPDSIAVSAVNATVFPGQTDQFNAAVNNSALTNVTWALTGPGAINSAGIYTAPISVTVPAQVKVTATLVSDPTQTSSATATVLELTALTVSPKGPTLAVGANQQFAAEGTFTDGTNQYPTDWTANSAWTSSNTTVATISATGAATADAAGATTISAKDSLTGTVTGTTAVNVTAQTMTAASLTGTYVFSITHAGTRGQAFSAGVFVADGTGLITGGVEDFNAPTGTASNVSILAGVGCGNTPPATDSCYTVSPDGRGSLHLTSASEGRGTDIYSFILSSDGSHGHLILSDSSGVEVGTFEKQTATTLGDGSYSLLLGGMDGTAISGTAQGPEALAGEFTISSGTISSATFDVNDNGAIDGAAACGATCPPPATALLFSAAYAQAGGNGRGQFVITPTGSAIPVTQLVSGSWNFDFFVVSADKIVLIQTDPQGSTTPTFAALAGTAERQTFSGTPNLAGSNYVFLVERSAAEGLFGSAGQWEFQASPPNTLTGEMDANCLQSAPTCMATTTLTTITSSPYTVDATGRGTVAISTPRSYVFYAIGDPSSGTARMYVLETDNKTNAGVGMQQAASLSLPTGAMAFNMAQLATDGYDSSFSGQLTISGTDLSGIVDSNVAVNYVQTSSSNQASGTSLAGPDGNGRGTVTLNILNLPSPGLSTSYAFYLVSPSQMVIFGTSSNVVGHQNQDGTMEVQ